MVLDVFYNILSTYIYRREKEREREEEKKEYYVLTAEYENQLYTCGALKNCHLKINKLNLKMLLLLLLTFKYRMMDVNKRVFIDIIQFNNWIRQK